MTKRIVSLLLALVLVVGLIPAAPAQAETLGWEGWTPISTQAELAAIGASSESLKGKYYLTQDITLTGEWTPIGLESGGFVGILDGNGHTISNVSITSPTKGVAGLFNYLATGYSYPNSYKAVVRNLNVVVDFRFTLGDYSYTPSVGGIAASNMGGLIYNCNVSGTMKVYANSGIYLGGLVGDSSGAITDCNSSVTITHASVDKTTENFKSVGGIVGYGCGNFTACGNTGDITVDAQVANVGGILGYSTSTGDIKDCYNSGNLTVNNQRSDDLYGENHIGGILGYVFSDIAVSRCYNKGEITSNGNYWNYAGGIIGLSQNVDLSQCFNTGSVRAVSYSTTSGGDPFAAVGGLVGSADDATVTDCYNRGTVGAAAYSNQSSYRFPCPYMGGLVGSALRVDFVRCFNVGYVTMSPACPNYWIGGIVGMDWERDEADECTYTNTYWLYASPYMVGIDQKPSWSTANTAGQLSYSNFKTQSKFVNYNFTSTWVMGTDNPELRMEAEVPHVHSYETLTTRPATCTQKGLADGWYCSGCRLYFAEKETRAIDAEERWIPMTDHTPGTPTRENEVEGDCLNPGGYDLVARCSGCGEELSREHITVTAQGHSSGDPVLENVTPGADCRTPGTAESVVYCTKCGGEISRTTVDGEVGGHIDGDPVVVLTDKGEYRRVTPCAVCGDELKSTPLDLTTPDTWYGSSVATGFAGGSGTESDPYLIETAAQWMYFTTLPTDENNNLSGVHVRLIRDLDMNGYTVEPVAPFAGHFDGGKHVIRGINISPETGNAGLFQNLKSGAVVENITVSGTVHSANYAAGAIAGSVSEATVRGCVSEATVTGYYAGGIVGLIGAKEDRDAVIEDCINYANVSSEKFFAGGIAGKFAAVGSGEPKTVIIRRCVNTGAVFGGTAAGGILGDQWNGTLEQCVNMGRVESDTVAGGIVGYVDATAVGTNSKATVINCYNAGAIQASGLAAGIVGCAETGNNASVSVSCCYNVGTISGGTLGNIYVAPVSAAMILENNYAMTGRTDSPKSVWDAANVCLVDDYILRQQETFVGYDFEEIWTMGKAVDNYPYPVLRNIPDGMIMGGSCGGSYGEPEVLWTRGDDGYTVTVTMRCSCSDKNHVLTQAPQVEKTVTKATCFQDGSTLYTAVAVFGAHSFTFTKTEPIVSTGHTPGVENRENDTDGTCQIPGGYDWVRYCVDCGEELSRQHISLGLGDHVPAEPHREEGAQGTCKEPGYYYNVIDCGVCGEELSREAVDTGYGDHGEEATEIENEFAGTCKEQAHWDVVTYCTVCGDELDRETNYGEFADHVESEPEQVTVREGTCTESFLYDEVIYCSVCSEELSRERKEVEAPGHDAGEPVRENDTPGTCKVEATYEMATYCSVCSEELSRETFTDGYGDHAPGEPHEENRTAGDCRNEGSYETVVNCGLCGEELSRETVSTGLGDHVKGAGVIENEVPGENCQTRGSYDVVHSCTLCGEELERTTHPGDLGSHIPGEAVRENEQAPGCEDEGSYVETVNCSCCGTLLSSTVIYTDPTGHTPGEPQREITLPGTCQVREEYVELVNCVDCGKELSRTTGTGDFGDHSTHTVPGIAPGCETDGLTDGEKCGICGKVFVEQEIIPSDGHEFGEWTVSREPGYYTPGEHYRLCHCGEEERESMGRLANPFTDVKEGEYFCEPVLWAAESGITMGTTPTTFGPEETCTRAQVVTFLWRAKGQPEPASKVCPFDDVKPEDYFYKAVLWAVENGITAGTDPGKFSPEDPCTRAQVATFLWRAKGEPEPKSLVSVFSDVAQSEYYYDAVLWAVEKGITQGTGGGKFSPDESCTRAQIVTFLFRDANG